MELKRVFVSKVNKTNNLWKPHKCANGCTSGDSIWCKNWLTSVGKGLWIEIELQNYVQLSHVDEIGNSNGVPIQVKIKSKFVQDLVMMTGRSDELWGKRVPMYSLGKIHDPPRYTPLENTSQCVFAPHHSGASIVGIMTKKVFEDGKFKPGASPP